MSAPPAPTATFPARAYGRSWRVVAGGLLFVGWLSVPVITLRVLFASDPPITPLILRDLFVALTVAPHLAAWAIGRALGAGVRLGAVDVVLSRRGLRVEVPLASIARVEAWRAPLPEPGFTLRLRSGRQLAWGLGAADPTPLLAALADAGIASARTAATHPTLVVARARQAGPRARWHHLAAKFPLFALLPAGLLFYTHQHIAYGGTFGQYYLLGLVPYLRTFWVHWRTVTIYLLLYAGCWRGAAEGIALVAAAVAPSRAARVRRAVETICLVAYYGGVPLLLGLRYLPG